MKIPRLQRPRMNAEPLKKCPFLYTIPVIPVIPVIAVTKGPKNQVIAENNGLTGLKCVPVTTRYKNEEITGITGITGNNGNNGYNG